MAELEAAGESITEVDRAFHLLLYKGLQNPLVDNLIELFWEIFVRLGDAIPAPVEGGRAAVHLRIVEALQSGEAIESIQRMQQHFDDVRARAAMLRSHPPLTGQRLTRTTYSSRGPVRDREIRYQTPGRRPA